MDDRIESGGLMMEKYREWWKEKRAGKRAVEGGLSRIENSERERLQRDRERREGEIRAG